MNDQNHNTSSSTPAAPAPVSGDWRELRRQERMARREEHMARHGTHRFGWFGGAVLVILGFALLLENLGLRFLENWWALFILIPAFWSYVAAYDNYQDNGRLTRTAAGSLTVGGLLTLLTLIFLFNIGFGVFWPVLLIVAGLAFISVGFVPR
jgi:hypothetical protein